MITPRLASDSSMSSRRPSCWPTTSGGCTPGRTKRSDTIIRAIVVAENAKQAGPSRSASAEEWQAILQEEVVKRIGRYDGEKLYHLGLNIDAYALALPGVPLVFKPKSILSITANVWDDTAQRRINMEPKVILVFEKGSPKTYVGSGITQDREEQMHNLAAAAAREIGKWLVENKAWFSPEAVAIRAASPGRDLPPLASE